MYKETHRRFLTLNCCWFGHISLFFGLLPWLSWRKSAHRVLFWKIPDALCVRLPVWFDLLCVYWQTSARAPLNGKTRFSRCLSLTGVCTSKMAEVSRRATDALCISLRISRLTSTRRFRGGAHYTWMRTYLWMKTSIFANKPQKISHIIPLIQCNPLLYIFLYTFFISFFKRFSKRHRRHITI